MDPKPLLSLKLKALASTRSLITNPTTSDSTISSILQTLTSSLHLHPNRHVLIKLLADLASSRPSHSAAVFDALRSASPLSLSAISGLPLHDDGLFLSLCFGADAPLRLRLLRNAEGLGVRSSLLLAAFLGFTKDPYPYVREAALNGLAGMCRGFDGSGSVAEECYSRAVELLKDSEDCVRAAAVRAVSEWGQMLVAISDQEEGKRRNWSDAVFLQLGAAVRDMCMAVRVEAFDALKKITTVSEDILLYTIPDIEKKEDEKEKEIKERFTVWASGAARAFMHGLEDEFSEVRKSACRALQSLAVLSAKSASRSLKLLVDMLNDDATFVRSAALEALQHLAIYERLEIKKDTHMHMLFSTFMDKNALIRFASRKLFKLVKLPNLELFRMSICRILESLKIYPEDEAGVFSVLFSMGRNHGKFAVSVIEEVSIEIDPVSEENMGLSSVKAAAFLVLAISVPLSPEMLIFQSIPPHLFSYAVTILGRISYALKDIMDQSTLLMYLSQCSRSSSKHGQEEFMCTDYSFPVGSTVGSSCSIDPSSFQCGEASEVQFSESSMLNSSVKPQSDEHNEEKDLVNAILAKVATIWPMIQSGEVNDVINILRVCKEELSMLSPECFQCRGLDTFALRYLEIMELLAKVSQFVWCQDMPLPCGVGSLDILLGNLDENLRVIRCTFIGLSEAEELHIRELMLLSCMLRLSKGEISYSAVVSRKLSSVMLYLEQQGGPAELSNFAIEVKKLLEEHCITGSGFFCCSIEVKKLLNLFPRRQFSVPRRLRHVHVELDVCGNNSENPLPFVPGLPMAIPLEITLYEVMNYNRLWLRIRLSAEAMQFVFFDHNVVGAFKQMKKLPFVACFHRTPKAISFTLRVCVGMECQFEDSTLGDVHGGPSHPLVYLCHEKEVHVRMHRNVSSLPSTAS